MQITVISFDPEGSLFAAIRQKELPQVENWVFSDSFENFIAHFQSVSGGILVLRYAHLSAVEAFLKFAGTRWQFVVVCDNIVSTESVTSSHPDYFPCS